MTNDAHLVPTPSDISAALLRIRQHVRRTPVMGVEASDGLGLEAPAVLKLELLQHAGSFKPRGAFNRALTEDVPEAGLIAASGGNHGAAIAHVATSLGVPAEVFVPGVSPQIKRDRIAELGAQVTVVGRIYNDAQEACDTRAAETGALQIHPYNHIRTVEGAGTVAAEFIDQSGGLDTIIVAAGGGGLSAGVAAYCRDGVKVVVVEPKGSRCVGAAIDAGEPVTVPVESVAADSLGSNRVGDVPWASLRRYSDAAITVDDGAIVDMQRRLWRSMRLIAEPGGAAALAALSSRVYVPEAGERVGVIVCGSNADPSSIIATSV